MIKYIVNFMIVIAIISVGVSMISPDLEHSNTYYERISSEQNITNEVKLNQVIDWFKSQGDIVTFESSKNDKNKTVTCTYTFKNGQKDTGTIELIYDSLSLSCTTITLSMVINGSRKTLTNKDAVRGMLIFLNSNPDFNYYFFK